MADPIPGLASFGLLNELLAEQAGGCDPARVAALEAENARLRAQVADQGQTITTLRERVVMADAELAIYRNAKLGAAKATAAAVARIFHAERPTRDEPAGYRVPLAKVADLAGLSEDAASRQLTTLAGMTTEDGTPVLIKEVITVPETTVVDADGVIIDTIPLHKEMWVGPGVDRAAFAKTLATLDPTNRKPHGGKRVPMGFCPDHPNSQVNKRTGYECASCNQPITTDTIQRLTREQFEAEWSEPNRQDAGTTYKGRPAAPHSAPLAASSHQTGKMPVRPDPSFVPVPAEPAGWWPAPAPLTPLTDVAHGRRAP